jgi:hypothetical protein
MAKCLHGGYPQDRTITTLSERITICSTATSRSNSRAVDAGLLVAVGEYERSWPSRWAALALALMVFHQKVIHSQARGIPEILIGSQNIRSILKLSAFPYRKQEYNGSSPCKKKDF